MKYRLTRNLLSLLCLWLLSLGTHSFAGPPGSESSIGQRTTIELSDTERQWVLEHPVIRLGVDPAWPPFDFIDRQGVHRGMAADFLQLLAQRLDISVEMIPDIGWDQALERARDRTLDLVSLSHGTPERLEFMTYTDVVTSVPWSIVTQKDYKEIDGLNDLAGLEVALVKGYAVEELILADYPGIRIRQVASSLDGLRAVASGQVKAMVESLAVASYLITENNLVNLRIAADSGLDVMKLGFGVRSDWPQLVELLNRAIRSLSRDEVRAIYTRWAPLAAPPANDAAPIEHSLWWFIAAGLIVLVLLIPVLLQRLSGDQQEEWFSSAAVRRIGAVAVALFLGVVMVLAWYSLERVNNQLRNNIGNQLSIINNSVHQSLRTWFEGRKGLVFDLAHEPGVLDATAALLAAPRNPQALRGDPAMKRLRTLLKPRLDRMNARGIFIIAPDRVSIASMRDANLGTRNLIAQQRSKLMDRAFAGETVFIPPIVSDVPLRDQHGQMVQHAPTMFFATPLLDANGKVVAVFTVRFEPVFDLTRITETGRPGESGETYAIDENGRLLTVSRFEESLIDAGIATETGTGDTSIQGLRIADPGGNLLSGHVPKSGRSEWPLTLMASEATHGRSGMDVVGYRDYRGVPVIGAWLWSKELGIGLTTEIDADEALAPYLTLRNLVIGALGVTALLALALTGLSVWLGDRAKARLERLVEERTRELKKLVQAVEQSPLCVVITDVDGKIEHVNPAFTRVTGYQPDEVIGKNPRLLKSGETSPDQYASLWSTILEGKVWRSEIRNRKKNGELYWGSVSIAPVTDDAGTVTHFIAMTDDITEAKEVELALQEARERNDLILDSAGEGIFGLDVEGQVTFCNRAAADMLGYGADELLGASMHDTVHYAHGDGDAYDEEACPMRAAFHDGVTRHIDGEVLWRKDGTAFPVEYSATPISHGGNLVGAVIVFRDITERKRSEDTLRTAKLAAEEATRAKGALLANMKESEEQFRTLVANIPGTTYRCLPRHPWTMLYISDEIRNLSGYPSEDFLGENPLHTFGDLMHPDDIEPVAANTALSVKEHRPYDNEYRVIDTDGVVHWVYAKGQAVYGADGEPEYLDGTIFDISDRLKAEERLRQSEERLEAAASGANLGLWDFFPQRGEILVDATWASMLGYEPGNIRETNDKWSRLVNGLELWRQLVHPDDLEPTSELIRQHLEGQTEIYRAEYRMRCADGSWKWILDAGQVTERDDAGQALRMNGIHADIEESKRLQAELEKAKEAADAANQAKSAFLANMSHELRTPMNAILGYSEMLIEEAEDMEQEDFIPDLQKINKAGTHLLALINDVLDLAKVESGKMEAFAEDINIDNLIDEVSGTAHPLMEKNNNTLSIERGNELGKAHQDLTKLRQTLFNLLSNAAKFTHDGTITLHVSRTEQAGADWLTFAVSDTGIGIAADKIDHVFEEFTQADNSTTRDYGGTGLGLAISRRFCKLLGGDLGAASELGKGSTFTIHIPAILPEGQLLRPSADTATTLDIAETESESLHEAGPGATVLVIDDDPEAREIIERFLVKDGFSVVTAGSGEQGLRLAHELQPAVITLDVMMPGMNGWSVLRMLKADPKLHNIPVIMVSMIDDRTRGYSLGAVDYLTKPIDRNLLHKALSRYYSVDGTSSVLLVEDDIKTREMMARTLKKAGWSVSVAGNGQEALDIMGASQPHLILLDLMMPVMDGFGFLAEMHAKPEWQHIPVIVVTAKDLTQEDCNRLAGSVEQVLEKNAYTREQLLERVREAVATCNIKGASD